MYLTFRFFPNKSIVTTLISIYMENQATRSAFDPQKGNEEFWF